MNASAYVMKAVMFFFNVILCNINEVIWSAIIFFFKSLQKYLHDKTTFVVFSEMKEFEAYLKNFFIEIQDFQRTIE